MANRKKNIFWCSSSPVLGRCPRYRKHSQPPLQSVVSQPSLLLIFCIPPQSVTFTVNVPVFIWKKRIRLLFTLTFPALLYVILNTWCDERVTVTDFCLQAPVGFLHNHINIVHLPVTCPHFHCLLCHLCFCLCIGAWKTLPFGSTRQLLAGFK